MTLSSADAAAPPAPKSVILDVYGAHVRGLGGWLAVAHLVTLMADLGHEEPAVRAAVSRMKRSGMLVAESRGAAAGYALTPAALDILRNGDERLFHSATAPDLADGWVVAVFSVPEQAREKRHRLRSLLIRLGFGQVTPGAWVAPRHIHPEVARRLAHSELAEHVSIFGGAYLGCPDIDRLVGAAWDLGSLDRRYREFSDVHSRTARAWRRPGAQSDRQGFIDSMRVLAAWRRLAYLDPGLPAELLPRRWGGRRARALFTQLHTQLEPRAAAHVLAVVGGGDHRA